MYALTTLTGCENSSGGSETPGASAVIDGSADTAPVGTPRGELSIYPAYIQMPTSLGVYPDVETGQEVDWSSSDTSVATVGADGKITGVAEGEVVITATVKGKPSVTATCGVKVVMSAADMTALIAEAETGVPDETDAGSPSNTPDTAIEDDTEVIIIWEDAPPEKLPDDWDEDVPDDTTGGTSDSTVIPTSVRAGSPQAQFIPLAMTGGQQNNVVNLANDGALAPLPSVKPSPKGIKIPPGYTEIKLSREKVKEAFDMGFIWTIHIASRKTGTAYDDKHYEFPITFTFRLKATKQETVIDFGAPFEGYGQLFINADTSIAVREMKSHKKEGMEPPWKWVSNWNGAISGNFHLFYSAKDETDDMAPLTDRNAYKTLGESFEWNYLQTQIYSYKEEVLDWSHYSDRNVSYTMKVNKLTHDVSLMMTNPCKDYCFREVAEPTITFRGTLYITPYGEYYARDPGMDDALAPLERPKK
jgi:hypothetical protein